MTLLTILAVGGFAVTLSEGLGRGRVLYVRLLGLAASYIASAAFALAAMPLPGGEGPAYAAAVFLSGLPFLGAWFGFRVHLSNSITLKLTSLLETERGKTYLQILEEYDPAGRIEARLENLRMAGLLSSGSDPGLADHRKARLLHRLILFLRKTSSL